MEPRLTEKESKQTKNISLKPVINRKRPYPDDLLMMINDTKEPMMQASKHPVDYEELTYLNNESASCSPNYSAYSDCSSVSASSFLDNHFDFEPAIRRKILITEERMAEALKELHIKSGNSHQTQEQSPNNKSIYNENENNRKDLYFLSDELKKTIKYLNDDNCSQLNKIIMSENQSKMLQLIPYIPLEIESFFEASSSSSSSSLCEQPVETSEKQIAYKVEEPIDYKKKNLLKRKYSQINKITIEELKQNDSNDQNQEESNAYLVEFEEEKVLEIDKKNSFKFEKPNEQIPFKTSANKPNIYITELDENENSVLSRFNKTNLNLLEVEAMDI